MTNPEDAVIAAIDQLERDDIDELVDWQMRQARPPEWNTAAGGRGGPAAAAPPAAGDRAELLFRAQRRMRALGAQQLRREKFCHEPTGSLAHARGPSRRRDGTARVMGKLVRQLGGVLLASLSPPVIPTTMGPERWSFPARRPCPVEKSRPTWCQ